VISAPEFKPEDKYLTNEGWGLGEPCWYCIVEEDGLILYACALTPEEACIRAGQLESAIRDGKDYFELKAMMSKWEAS
jgi:hypothetical protein